MSVDESEQRIGKLRQRMKNLLESVSLLENFIHKFNPEEHQCQVQVRLAKLEEFFAQFFDAAAELEAQSTKKNPILLQNERFSFESKYYALRAALQSKLPKPDLPSFGSVSASTVASTSVAGFHIRYPELPLLKFSENRKIGSLFGTVSSLELSTGRKLTGKNSVDKLQYLKGLVQGDTARLIGHIEISEKGYRIAWKV